MVVCIVVLSPAAITNYSIADMSSQLFRAMGYRVTAIKIDPYLNVDAGTMVSIGCEYTK